MKVLDSQFFDRDASAVAQSLLGVLIRRKYNDTWLTARIIETEAYYLEDKGSHASLGFTEKRKALFMPAGTIYMYYARGQDSLNISCRGEGNAVLIKSAYPHIEGTGQTDDMIRQMQQLNPSASGKSKRTIDKLCNGQTLLCRSLQIKVNDWDQKPFDPNRFYFADHVQPKKIIQTSRLGIPEGRDPHLPYRFIDYDYARFCTSNPLTKRGWHEGREYKIIV